MCLSCVEAPTLLPNIPTCNLYHSCCVGSHWWSVSEAAQVLCWHCPEIQAVSAGSIYTYYYSNTMCIHTYILHYNCMNSCMSIQTSTALWSIVAIRPLMCIHVSMYVCICIQFSLCGWVCTYVRVCMCACVHVFDCLLNGCPLPCSGDPIPRVEYTQQEIETWCVRLVGDVGLVPNGYCERLKCYHSHAWYVHTCGACSDGTRGWYSMVCVCEPFCWLVRWSGVLVEKLGTARLLEVFKAPGFVTFAFQWDSLNGVNERHFCTL